MLAIKNAHTPTLVVHSQRDMRLDVSEGLQLFTALQLLGVPSRMLYFPDEGHWILKPQNSQLWNETVNDWCDRWLGMNKYADEGTGEESCGGEVEGTPSRHFLRKVFQGNGLGADLTRKSSCFCAKSSKQESKPYRRCTRKWRSEKQKWRGNRWNIWSCWTMR